ncbi:hypothetical protein MtrunA17_Chr3g0115001 [Medicago truncatula]|uniref:Transmembrane protein n=1 Tax=Medicago truncatula TaxID=3880 RepID=A0A396IV72_MEDTR|nr:hypothetical protein MtrunA17_Chr3g0115001 [Medicago truncatula]
MDLLELEAKLFLHPPMLLQSEPEHFIFLHFLLVEVVVAVLLPSAAVVGFEHSYKPKNLLPLPKRVVFLFFVAFGFLFGLYDL